MKTHVRSGLHTWKRPISTFWCVLSWIGASILFLLLVRSTGGVTSADANLSINSTWAVAHGSFSCAYPPTNTLGGNPRRLHPSTSSSPERSPPSFDWDKQFRFPPDAQMGAHCANTVNLIEHWDLRSHALSSTVLIGYVGWLAVLAGALTIVRAAGRGRTLDRTTDGGATGLRYAGLHLPSPVLPSPGPHRNGPRHERNRECNPRSLDPGWRLPRLGSYVPTVCGADCRAIDNHCACFATIGGALRDSLRRMLVVDLPVVLFTSGRSINSIIYGTAGTTEHGTWLEETHLTGPLLFRVARLLPLVAGAALALWVRRRVLARERFRRQYSSHSSRRASSFDSSSR